MAKHAVTPIQTISPARGAETVRKDLRSQLLNGLPIAERRLSLNNLSTAVLEGGDGSPIVLLHGPAAYAAPARCRAKSVPAANRG